MFADGSLGVRRIWWLLQCSHLMVPLCIVVCPVGAHLTAVCGTALCPVALLLAFLPISGFFFFCWHAHCCWCAAPGGQHVAPCIPLWLSGCPTCRHAVSARVNAPPPPPPSNSEKPGMVLLRISLCRSWDISRAFVAKIYKRTWSSGCLLVYKWLKMNNKWHLSTRRLGNPHVQRSSETGLGEINPIASRE